jgi:hypothetical protein
MTKSGAVSFEVEDNISIVTQGSYSLTSKKTIDFNATEEFTAKGSSIELEAVDEDTTIRAAVDVIIKAGGKVTMGPMVYVGDGSTPVLLATPALLSLIVGHGHAALNSPPTQASLVADQEHVSKTIFGK